MSFVLRRLSAFDGEAVLSLEDARAQCRVLHTDEDTQIAAYRNAAVAHVERVSGVILSPAHFEWTGDRFPCDLPVGPLTAVDPVTYLGSDLVEATYEGARLVNGRLAPAVGGYWPAHYGQVTVQFAVGLASPDQAPDLIAAVRLLIAHWFANREAVNIGNITSELPLAVEALIQTHRKVMV